MSFSLNYIQIHHPNVFVAILEAKLDSVPELENVQTSVVIDKTPTTNNASDDKTNNSNVLGDQNNSSTNNPPAEVLEAPPPPPGE